VRAEAFRVGVADLLVVDFVCGDAFLFYKFLDLQFSHTMSVSASPRMAVSCSEREGLMSRTISNIFNAFSLTYGRAISGTFWLAVGCLSAPATLLMLYGTDMMIADPG